MFKFVVFLSLGLYVQLSRLVIRDVLSDSGVFNVNIRAVVSDPKGVIRLDAICIEDSYSHDLGCSN